MRFLSSSQRVGSTLCILYAILLCLLTRSAEAQQDQSDVNNLGAQAPAQAAPLDPASARIKPDSASDAFLKLGVGDLLDVSVYGIPDLATRTRIDSNGEIYLPLIAGVKVAGLTVREAEDLIQIRLSSEHYLKDPHVSVFVDEYATQGASILGEVVKPGVYPVLGPQSLFNLISMAGGLTEKAGHIITVTHRGQQDKPVSIPMARNLSDNSESNVAVFPGDTIIVHRADVVYVVGDVGRPSGLLIESGGLTVLRAIALSGGTNRTAQMNGLKILRKGPTGMTEMPVRLKNILKAKDPDLELLADDVLVVPASGRKILAGRTLEAAMQAATLVSVTAIP